jgi:hypothetical protein
MRRVLLGFCLCWLACVPWPHRVRLAPAVSGTLHRDGQPLAGVPLRLDTWGEPRQRVATDGGGAFSFQPPERFDFFVVFGDPLYDWQVVVDEPDGGTLWTGKALGSVPQAQRLTCETGEGVEVHCVCAEDFDGPSRTGRCRSDQGPSGPEVCPARPGHSVRRMTVFDGPPEELASLVPDRALAHWGYWTLGDVYDAGRFVSVRCEYDDGRSEDVKLTNRVSRCEYQADEAGAFEVHCGSAR